VVDWTSGSLEPINAFNPAYGNSAISYYSPTSFLRRVEQTGFYLQDLIELIRKIWQPSYRRKAFIVLSALYARWGWNWKHIWS
jgi:hypothetical protein